MKDRYHCKKIKLFRNNKRIRKKMYFCTPKINLVLIKKERGIIYDYCSH